MVLSGPGRRSRPSLGALRPGPSVKGQQLVESLVRHRGGLPRRARGPVCRRDCWGLLPFARHATGPLADVAGGMSTGRAGVVGRPGWPPRGAASTLRSRRRVETPVERRERRTDRRPPGTAGTTDRTGGRPHCCWSGAVSAGAGPGVSRSLPLIPRLGAGRDVGRRRSAGVWHARAFAPECRHDDVRRGDRSAAGGDDAGGAAGRGAVFWVRTVAGRRDRDRRGRYCSRSRGS